MTHHCFTAGGEHAGMRLDSFVAQSGLLSRSAAQKRIEAGAVLLNGRPADKKTPISENDRVSVELPEAQPYCVEPEAVPLDIVYEDAHLLVVNKPKGMVVHPAAGHAEGTLVNALMHHCGDSLSGINGVMRPGILHRIDKDTSGLLLVAKNDAAHRALSAQLQSHSLERAYAAVVYGHPAPESGRIDLPVGRHPVHRKKMAVLASGGRAAVTDYETQERLRGFSLLRLRLHTGRTHQIRVHMSHMGHPLAGDTLYGPKKAIAALHGQCLHAQTLGFIHPASGEYRRFDSDLPDEFLRFLAQCRVE